MVVDAGYFSVTLEPLPRLENQIPLPELQERVLQATVSLRGWDYPHLDREIHSLDGGIESRTDWQEYHERWRLMDTGFFAHRWRMREDGIQGRVGTLDFINALWSITEVWTFARRLYGQDATVERLGVILTLDGLRGRKLTGDARYYLPIRAVPSSEDKFRREVVVARPQLLTEADRFAVDWSLALFHRMGATGISSDVLREHQLRLLERRFG
jgi:hypothetical protein